MKRLFPSTDFSIELAAGIASSVAIVLGSTTLTGAVIGVTAGVPWWALMIRRGMWGLLPVNVVATLAYVFNLWRIV